MSNLNTRKSGTKAKKRSAVRTTKQIQTPEEHTVIKWGLFRRNPNSNGYVNGIEDDCLLSGRSFDDENPVKALECAFSSIAQVIGELNLERGTEVRVAVRKRG